MKEKIDNLMGKQLNQWEENNWNVYRKRYVDSTPTAQQSAVDAAVEILSSRSGLPTMRVTTKTGQSVFLHSSVDPVKEAQRVASSFVVQAGKLVVVYGFGLGYLVEVLLGQLDDRIPLFVIEPNQSVFQQAMRARDLQNILASNRVYIQVGDSIADIENSFFVFYDVTRFNNIVLTGLSAHQIIFSDFYTESVEAIKQVVNSTVMEWETLAKIGPQMVTGTISNFIDFGTHPGVGSLFDKFVGVPAIIVAAGPSLDRNIKLLREAKGRAIIIAVGTAVKPLQKQGIVPDFIVSIDPMSFNYDHFKEYSSQSSALLADIQSYPAILQTFQGPIFVAENKTFIVSWFDGAVEAKGDLETGGTAAHSAMTAAYKMGADPIIFVGQDLAFANGGHTHAAGTIYGDAGTSNNIYTAGDNVELFYVEASDGGQVLTNRLFNEFRLYIEKWTLVKSDRIYINATEGGALIKGTKIMTLQEALKSYCTELVNVWPVVLQAQQEYCKPSIKESVAILYRRLVDAERILEVVTSVVKRLKQLQQACEKRDSVKMQKYARNINKTFKQFEEDPYIRPAVEFLAYHTIHHITYRRNEALYAEDNDVQKAVADYDVYYKKIYEEVKRVKGLIEQAIKCAEERHN